MTTHLVLLILTLFALKHFIADFLLQKPYQYLNKGKYGHTGGILHSAIHAGFTFIIVLFFAPSVALLAAVIDFVVHYHVDWAKVQINTKYGWGPNTHQEYWWLLGLDQFLHMLTYVGIVWMMII